MLWKIAAIAAAVAALFGGRTYINGCDSDYGDGERSGVVSKFSLRGIIIKSWEGELIVGTNTNDRTAARSTAGVFKFSVTSDVVAQAIQTARESGRRTTLRYRQWFHRPMAIDTDYDVVEVKQGEKDAKEREP